MKSIDVALMTVEACIFLWSPTSVFLAFPRIPSHHPPSYHPEGARRAVGKDAIDPR
jgi:hypothetical protein